LKGTVLIQVGPNLARAIPSPVAYINPTTPSVPNSQYLTPVIHDGVVNKLIISNAARQMTHMTYQSL